MLDAAPKAIADPNDYAARADLMWAGMLAHNNSCGVGREQDWASHQIEHELSAFYDCAHGAGLAVILPAWMEYVLPHDPVRLAQFAVRVFGCEMNFADPEATARQGIEKLCLFFHSLGMPITFDELGAKAKDIPDMVAHRAEKPGGFPFGGFVKIQPADMEAILRLAAGEAQSQQARPGIAPRAGFCRILVTGTPGDSCGRCRGRPAGRWNTPQIRPAPPPSSPARRRGLAPRPAAAASG